jgi:hypothetical protein
VQVFAEHGIEVPAAVFVLEIPVVAVWHEAKQPRRRQVGSEF